MAAPWCKKSSVCVCVACAGASSGASPELQRDGWGGHQRAVSQGEADVCKCGEVQALKGTCCCKRASSVVDLGTDGAVGHHFSREMELMSGAAGLSRAKLRAWTGCSARAVENVGLMHVLYREEMGCALLFSCWTFPGCSCQQCQVGGLLFLAVPALLCSRN